MKKLPNSSSNKASEDSSLVKISDAAEMVGVSIDTLRRWEKEGKISPIRTPGGTRLYPRFVKIGEASSKLGLSIDTLRRWEKTGKISSLRTPGGTRLYSLESLRKINPNLDDQIQVPAIEEKVPELSPQLSNTSQLLEQLEVKNNQITHDLDQLIATTPVQINEQNQPLNQLQSEAKREIYATIYARIYAILPLLLVVAFLTALTSGAIAGWYLKNPAQAKAVLSSSSPDPVRSMLVTAFGPFDQLAQKEISLFLPAEAKKLGFVSASETKIAPASDPRVLAASTIAQDNRYLQINADTSFTGNIAVEGQGVFN